MDLKKVIAVLLVMASISVSVIGCGISDIQNFLANRENNGQPENDISHDISDQIETPTKEKTEENTEENTEKKNRDEYDADFLIEENEKDLTSENQVNAAVLRSKIIEYLDIFQKGTDRPTFEYSVWSENIIDQGEDSGEKILLQTIAINEEENQVYYYNNTFSLPEIYADIEKETIWFKIPNNENNVWYKSKDKNLAKQIVKATKQYLPDKIIERHIKYVQDPEAVYTITKIQAGSVPCYKMDVRKKQQTFSYYIDEKGNLVTFMEEERDFYGDPVSRIWFELKRRKNGIKPNMEKVAKQKLSQYLKKEKLSIFHED